MWVCVCLCVHEHSPALAPRPCLCEQPQRVHLRLGAGERGHGGLGVPCHGRVELRELGQHLPPVHLRREHKGLQRGGRGWQPSEHARECVARACVGRCFSLGPASRAAAAAAARSLAGRASFCARMKLRTCGGAGGGSAVGPPPVPPPLGGPPSSSRRPPPPHLLEVVHGQGVRLEEARGDRVGVVVLVPAQLRSGERRRRRGRRVGGGQPHTNTGGCSHTWRDRMPCAVSIVTPRM